MIPQDKERQFFVRFLPRDNELLFCTEEKPLHPYRSLPLFHGKLFQLRFPLIPYVLSENSKFPHRSGKEEEIWNKQYVILEPKEKNTTENVLEINENLDIDLKQYNELVNDFIEKMQMAITTKLYIEFNTNITAHVNGEMMLDQYTNRLEVSLGDKVTKIVGDEEDSKEKEVNKKIQVTKEGNKSVAVLSSVVLIISIYVIIKVQKETKTMNKITNMFKVELNQILGACGDRIVKIDSEINTTGITLIELKDINELVKLSEELYKPILYYQVPNKKEAWFCLTLENETYRYILK